VRGGLNARFFQRCARLRAFSRKLAEFRRLLQREEAREGDDENPSFLPPFSLSSRLKNVEKTGITAVPEAKRGIERRYEGKGVYALEVCGNECDGVRRAKSKCPW
jgi:hypothetical protein